MCSSKNHKPARTSRLGSPLAILAAALVVMTVSVTNIPSGGFAKDEDPDSSWYFTSEEITAAYQYQQNYGERLRAPLRATECAFRDGDFPTYYRGARSTLPCRFVTEVTRHLKQMIEVGAARYLFPLDADHAHLGVPKSAWNNKYKNLPPEEIFPALVRDPGLVALYHTAEHLRITDRKTGAVSADAKAWQEKRNVLGYFDGRPIKILPPHHNGQGASMPEEYYSYSDFTFLASPRGELFLSLGTTMVTFDVAFEADHNEEIAFPNLTDGEKVLTRTSR
jgi:hypothetical protein